MPAFHFSLRRLLLAAAVVAVAGPAPARDLRAPDGVFAPNLSAPIERRTPTPTPTRTICTDVPGGTRSEQVCDGRGQCRTVIVPLPSRRDCRQVR